MDLIATLKLNAKKNEACQTSIRLIDTNNYTQDYERLNYEELLNYASAFATSLAKSTQEKDRIILLYESGIDFIIAFLGCLISKRIAIPLPLPFNKISCERLLSCIQDSDPSLILTTESLLNTHIHHFLIHNNLNDIRALSIKHTKSKTNDILIFPDILQSDIAFLQYTSGTTSSPKGVVITHQNLISNIKSITQSFNLKQGEKVLCWLPHSHDMGLIGNILSGLYIGMELIITQPYFFLRNTIGWVKVLCHYKINLVCIPPSLLKICLDHLDLHKNLDVNLSTIKNFVIGAESISPDILDRTAKTLYRYNLNNKAISPSYGLAESTLLVSRKYGVKTLKINKSSYENQKIILETAPKDNIFLTFVSCGTPILDIKIINPKYSKYVEQKDIGEICIHGNCVSHGYWDKCLKSYKPGCENHIELNGRTYFRTGDIGFLYNNELFITGRLKEVIIINGLNYYPQDIEKEVLTCINQPYLITCVVFPYHNNKSKTDSFVILLKSKPMPAYILQIKIIKKIKQHILKSFNIIPHDVRFLQNKVFPKTTSGKTQRLKCVRMYMSELNNN